MPPGGEKSAKSDALQAVVQVGDIGFYPLNSLAVTALHRGQTKTIIAARDENQTGKLRLQSELKVGKDSLPVTGKLCEGLSDAFYRGRLPEVLIVTSPMAQVPAFLEELMDFLEKLCALGFLTQKDQDEVTMLNRYVPQIVLASYGVVYDVVLEKVGTAIENIKALSPRQRERLLQKFSRGVITTPGEGYDLNLEPLAFYPKPLALKLAGSKSMFTIRTTQLLETWKIAHEFNPNAELGAMEFELNLAYNHLAHRVLPLLAQSDKAWAKRQDELTQAFDALGQALGMLPGLVTLAAKTSELPKIAELGLSLMDLALVHQVMRWVREANQSSSLPLFESLLDAVGQVVKPLSPVQSE